MDKETLMSVKEVAEILNVTPEAIKKHIRELYLDVIKNGVATLLTEKQVTEIKRRMLPTTEVVGSVTRLEMMQNIQRDMQWLVSFNEELRRENEIQKKRQFKKNKTILQNGGFSG